jgi:predicted membrane protein
MQKIPGRIIIGVYIVLLGVGWLLDGLKILNLGEILGIWWPTYIFILWGILSLFTAGRSFLWSAILILGGLALQFWKLEIFSLNFVYIFWPIILIVIGLTLILKKSSKKWVKSKESSEDEIDYFTMFGGIEKRINSRNFKGGNITVLFGGAEVDLSNAQFDAGAKIEIFNAFGGTSIIVPDGSQVIVSGAPIFGAWENKVDKNEEGDCGKIEIKGMCLFGGVEVINKSKKEARRD